MKLRHTLQNRNKDIHLMFFLELTESFQCSGMLRAVDAEAARKVDLADYSLNCSFQAEPFL